MGYILKNLKLYVMKKNTAFNDAALQKLNPIHFMDVLKPNRL